MEMESSIEPSLNDDEIRDYISKVISEIKPKDNGKSKR